MEWQNVLFVRVPSLRMKSVACHCVNAQSDGTMAPWQTLYSIEKSVSCTTLPVIDSAVMLVVSGCFPGKIPIPAMKILPEGRSCF